MSDYTEMSAYYDLIMTSGYYDYDAIVDDLARFEEVGTVLEIGAGTGLILERLVARKPELTIAGIDLTQSMLDIAVERLKGHPQISMHLQNVVTLSLTARYDLAFSYGGVWYFVPNGDRYSMISHIRDEQDNQQGLEQVAEYVSTGGRLLLGIQEPHRDYATKISNGMEYAQEIIPIQNGFRKHYSLADGTRTVMEQVTDYRTYSFEAALELLDKCGFEYQEKSGQPTGLFLEFTKR